MHGELTMSNDLISIIFPVYNAQEYLPVSVGAVLAQTYQNFELILVDDGSTDASGRICDDYAAQDARVKVFHKPNGGHSSAVNYGLARMAGKYVMICDTDDYYEPDAFQLALDRITQPDAPDAVIFAIYRPDREPVEDPASIVSFDKVQIDTRLLSGETYDFCNIGFHIESTWAKIIRADIIREHTVRMPEQLFLAEDAVFCLHLFEHCKHVVFDSHHIYHYDIREDSFCHKYSDVAVKMLPLILQEQEKYISRYHAGDRTYLAANDIAVFSWFNEAEEHFFFNEKNTVPFFEKYRQYRALLLDETVRRHVLDVNYTEAHSRLRKIRFAFYKNPVFALFTLYYFTKVKK